MKPYFNYLLVLLFFVFAKQLTAQNSQLRAYTIEDGLPQSQVYDLLQGPMGYLWLGTQGGGLANFDGATFKVWTENDGLASNYIHSLYAKSDSLFIGTTQGLSIKVKNKFINFKAPQTQQFYQIKHKIYLATQKGVYVFSQKGKLSKITINAEIDASAINQILFDGHYYWLATNNGLWRLNDLSTKATEISKIETNNFTAVLFYKDKIIAATFDDGVFIINHKNPKDNFLMPEPPRINSMSIQNNELWIATDDDGITVVETEKFAELKRLTTKNGLATPHIRKVINDAQGNIWIATSGGGFYKYFQNNFKHYDKRTGLKDNRIYAVHQAKDGLWISSSESGLTKIDSLGIHPIANNNSFFDVKIKTIASDVNGNIWAGSDDRGILFRETKMVDSLVFSSSDTTSIKIDTLTIQQTQNHVIDESKGFPSDWVRKIVVTKDFVWAATYTNGIVKFKYNSESDKLVIDKTFGKEEGITDLLIKDFVKGPNGKFWFSTKNGHLGYIEKHKVTMLNTELKQQTAIGTLLFYRNLLFLGTFGQGIWYTDASKPSNFKKLTGEKELTSGNIYQLIFDDQGFLWAGNERGVDKIKLNPNNKIDDLYHFGRNDGFLGIETCLNAVDKDKNGNLWFGAIYGLTQYTPSENTHTSAAPKIYFTGVEERYKSIDSINLTDWTNSDKVLNLNPEQTQLGFSFRSIDLDHPKAIEYRSKLDDTEWSPWGTENNQNFAGLAYGAHTFTVQSRNHRWLKSEPIAFNFFIDRPLYKKAWFQWLLTALAVLGVIAIAWRYIKKIRAKNNAAQERLKTENYLLSLEQKALRLQMNPHFIFNVLNGIKAMALNAPDKMNTTINSFAVLLRETLQNSRKETISLDQEIKALEHYIAVEKLMASKPFSSTIDIKTNPSAEEILIPPMLIQPFVENAIRHGILKGNRDGILHIIFHTSASHLHCSVVDNGMGIFKSQREKVKTDHQSMALVVTKERLASIAGENSLEIEEIKNKNGSIEGTKITFKIPLVTDY